MKSNEERLEAATSLLAPWTDAVEQPEENRLDVVVDATALISATRALTGARWGYLAAITGLDVSPDPETMEALYHFCSHGAVVTLRVRLPRAAPWLPSLAGMLPVAAFFERELSEMLGVEIGGPGQTERLFLPADWPEGLFPLRKDAPLPQRRMRQADARDQ